MISPGSCQYQESAAVPMSIEIDAQTKNSSHDECTLDSIVNEVETIYLII